LKIIIKKWAEPIGNKRKRFLARSKEHKEEKTRKVSHKKAQKTQRISMIVADLRYI